MTNQERRDHNVIDGKRRKAHRQGSGTTVQDVNTVLKQYLQMRTMMKQYGAMAARTKNERPWQTRGIVLSDSLWGCANQFLLEKKNIGNLQRQVFSGSRSLRLHKIINSQAAGFVEAFKSPFESPSCFRMPHARVTLIKDRGTSRSRKKRVCRDAGCRRSVRRASGARSHR